MTDDGQVLFKIPEALKLLKMSRSTFYREKFPTVPITTSGRARRVHLSDIRDYEARMLRRREEGE